MTKPSLQGQRVLVTGAGGFIGSHLVERLVAEGATVRAMVHYNALASAGWLDTSDKREQVEVMPGDIADAESVRRAVDGCSVVFHLAALIAIPYSYVAPRSYVRTNVEGTLNVLEACRAVGVERLLHTSTSEVYGTARYVPIDEAHPLQGQSPYSASKIGADQMAEAYHRSFKVPVVTVRPFNTFGPRQSQRAVIPTIISQVLAGDVVKLGSVRPTRDLNFVANTVDAFVSCAVADGVVGQTLHFGTGREISIGDLALAIAAIAGKEVRVEEEVSRLRPEASEVERLLADNSRAKKLIGWQPRIGLEAGLATTVEWMRTNIGHYRVGKYER